MLSGGVEVVGAAVARKRKTALMLHPMVPLKKDRYKYEAYKEAWPLLAKSKRALAAKYR